MNVQRKMTLGLAIAAVLATSSAIAQLTSTDNGMSVSDNNGLMWANTVGIDLGWSPLAQYADTAQAYIAGLNTRGYNGYNDWTLASIDQLSTLFYGDCGATRNTATALPQGCGGTFTTLSTAIATGTMGQANNVNFSSRNSLGLVPGENYYAWSIYRTTDSTTGGWDADTNNAGLVGRGDALAVREVPEIDGANAAAALTLLMGALLVIRSNKEAQR